jgi:hypothetical protein
MGGCSELVALAAEQRAGVDAEAVEEVAMLVGVDGVGELLARLSGLLVFAALAQGVDDLVLVDFHWQAPSVFVVVDDDAE